MLFAIVFNRWVAVKKAASRAEPGEENMNRSVKWALGLVLAASVSVGAVGAYNQEKLVRLWNVNSLFDEDRIVSNFSNMRDMFLSAPIRTGKTAFVFPRQIQDLTDDYTFAGQAKSRTRWLERTAATSLLVVRDGQIVAEDYYLGTKQQDQRISWSMAKSFLSAVFGIAVERGEISSIDDPVTNYVEELKGTAYDGATIRNVLHMSSGVKFDENYLDYDSDINRMGRTLALGGSMDEFAASLSEKQGKPGETRRYTSIDTHVLSMVLRKATGKSLTELLETNVISKLGFESSAYYLTDGYGVAFALGGLNITTRDYAKVGQLFLDQGNWRGEQIIPRNWAIESVKNTAPASLNQQPFGYGYQWWVPQNARDEFFAVGVYGQYLYVDRPSRTVIVKTSANRRFRDDGTGGMANKHETIEVFRAIVKGISNQQKIAEAGADG